MSSKSCCLVGLAATLALVCGTPALGGKPPVLSYQILQLDLDAAGITYADSLAYDISNPSERTTPRQVVGDVAEEDTPGLFRPACWTTSVVAGSVQSDLHVLLLPTTDGDGEAWGISASGEIVGQGWDGSQYVGLYWADYAAVPDVLPPLTGGRVSGAAGINKDGVICGFSEYAVLDEFGKVDHYAYRAVVWFVRGDAIVGPFPLSHPELVSAVAVNDNDPNGWADVVGGYDSAVVWTVRLPADGTFEVNTVVLDEVGRAAGVNNLGTVCGASVTSNPLLQAVVWAGGQEQALAGAKFYVTRAANDINDAGVIVGRAEYAKMWSGGQRAVMWSSATGSMVLLNQFLDDSSPLMSLSDAMAINNFGEIVGQGWAKGFPEGSPSAFLAIPK